MPGVLRQFADEPTGIVSLFLLVIFGSLVPVFLGEDRTKVKTLGPLNANAELINGRGAMIGFAAMLVLESEMGKALFQI